MNPLTSNVRSQHNLGRITTGQPPAASDSQAQSSHPDRLQPARVSNNAHSALKQHAEAHPEEIHRRLARLAMNGIKDGTMARPTIEGIDDDIIELFLPNGADAHYTQSVEVADQAEPAELTVHARSDPHTHQYDIVGISLYSPVTGGGNSITLSASHPDVLLPDQLSHRAQSALEQAEAHPEEIHQLLAMLAINGIDGVNDGTMQLSSTDGADAHYMQPVVVADQAEPAELRVHARSDPYTHQYDIVGISLYSPDSGITDAITLSSAPPPATAPDEVTDSLPPSGADQLAVQYSRDQLAQAMIRQTNPQDFRGAPLPSGASVASPPMAAFSHDDASPQPAQSVRSVPHPAASSGTRNTHQQDSETILRPPQGLTSQEKKEWLAEQIPDPRHPDSGKTIARSSYNRRISRARVVTAADGQETTAGKLSSQKSRQRLVEDPENPGGPKITRGELTNRKHRITLVEDPENPGGPKITRGELRNRKNRSTLVEDPENPGGPKTTRGALANRKYRSTLVEDPENPGGPKITRGERDNRIGRPQRKARAQEAAAREGGEGENA